MRKAVFDLDSSDLEGKALTTRKESRKHRIMKFGKNRAFSNILETGWYFSAHRIG